MIEIYAGRGASHSLVWLVDLLASSGYAGTRLVRSEEMRSVADRVPSCVVISGGDGYEISRSVGPAGFSSLSDYVASGGLYIGMCAGAYLPLPSRLEPFSSFNISRTRIRNLDLRCGSPGSCNSRLSVPYGDCSIIHPVRGMVSLTGPLGECVAPIYGGPVFEEPEEDAALLRFHSFTDRTEFHVPRDASETMMIGLPAVVECRHGRGMMVLLGPHLEFPGCADANRLFMSLLPDDGRLGAKVLEPVDTRSCPELDRAIADLKVSIVGLENRSFVCSHKLWDGGRLLELVDAIGRMRWAVEKEVCVEVCDFLSRARAGLMAIDGPGVGGASETPNELIDAFRLCANGYFAALRR